MLSERDQLNECIHFHAPGTAGVLVVGPILCLRVGRMEYCLIMRLLPWPVHAAMPSLQGAPV